MAGIKEAAVLMKVGVIKCFGSSHIQPIYENVVFLCFYVPVIARVYFLNNYNLLFDKTINTRRTFLKRRKTGFRIVGITLYTP